MTVLDSLVGKHPELIAAEAMLRTLASAVPEATLPAGVPHLGAVEARLASGVPALEGEPLLAGAELLANVRALATALQSVVPGIGDLPEALRRSLCGNDADELARVAVAGEWSIAGEAAIRCGLEPDVVVTLLDYAARPALRAGARAVHDLVAQSGWKRGTCPSCGAAPQLAELHGSFDAIGQRVLRCGRCLTGWPFPRLGCPACGETNHQQMAYLHGAGEDAFRRADVCVSCRQYLKSIAVLSPLGLTELLEMDLATAALDFAAMEQGFHR
jgi:FdhE protein